MTAVSMDLALQLAPGGRGSASGWWPRASAARRHSVNKPLLREKWARLAGDFVLAGGDAFPAGQVIATSSSPEELGSKLCAGRRASTIRKRLRECLRLQRWLHDCCSPSTHWLKGAMGTGQLIDYMLDRAREPCAPSVPQAVVTAVEFVEAIGGLALADRHRRHGMVQALSKELLVELAQGCLAQAKQKAPPLLLAMLTSMEKLVMNKTEPPYARLYAWCKLLRHWMALRWSDLLSMPPRLALMNEAGLEVTITSTKTTGPGKKVELLKAYVSRGAWLLEEGWLETGWLLFTGPSGGRDFFLPLPGRGEKVLSDKEPTYMDACGVSRKINGCLMELKTERRPDGLLHTVRDERGNHRHLLLPGVQTLWTEHGDRSTLVNWAARLGMPLEVRNALGRWSPQGSDEYLRTTRSTVLDTQNVLGERLRRAPEGDPMGEEDTLARLRVHLTEKGFHEELIDEQLRRLRSWRVPEAGAFLELRELDVDGFALVGAVAPGTPKVDSSDEDVGAGLEVPQDGEWVISQARQGKARTLHQVGRCWRLPGRHYRWFAETTEDMALLGAAGGRYEHACRDCFREPVNAGGQRAATGPAEVLGAGAVEAQPADSSSGSSSSSSDSESAGGSRPAA